jgi:hypothetical protein
MATHLNTLSSKGYIAGQKTHFKKKTLDIAFTLFFPSVASG